MLVAWRVYTPLPRRISSIEVLRVVRALRVLRSIRTLPLFRELYIMCLEQTRYVELPFYDQQ